MDDLNPPAGTFTREEYLEIYERWMGSFDQNKLSPPVSPFLRRFLGNKKVVIEDDKVRLEEI